MFDAYLKQADRVIRDVLSNAGEISSQRLMNKINRQLRVQMSPIYSGYGKELTDGLEALAISETEWTQKALSRGVSATIKAPSSAQVISAALARPMQFGNTAVVLKDLVKGFTDSEITKVQGIVRSGFFEGQTTSQMVQRIRGTKAANFNDGIMATTRRSARLIAKTATNHFATAAKDMTYNANEDVLEGVEWSSTLDSRTSNVCQLRDGQMYPVDSGPRPPAHPGCRSTIIPKVKPEFSLFRGNETRAAVGPEGAKTTQAGTYYGWMRTQPAGFQNEVLGTTKGKLFRSAGLDNKEFRRLVSNNFDEPLTLAEMRLKEPEVFSRAGL
jgi:SPP1 gp7 family putative phage head morphogenesis protein